MSSRSLRIKIARQVCFGTAMGVATLLASSTQAAYTLDRWYQMGDDIVLNGSPNRENAVNGQPVGSGNVFTGLNGGPITYDSSVVPGNESATRESLAAFGTNGIPTYVQYGVGGNPAAPVAGAASMNHFGIRFDGVDDYLKAVNFNDPSVSAPGSVQIYPDTINRGMQLWVRPTAVDAVRDVIIDDADFHGFNILENGNWHSEIRESVLDTTISAANSVNQWTHLMMIHDTVKLGSVVSYINGLAVASQTTGYTANASVNLLVGANAEESVGLTADPATLGIPGFFNGIVDEIEMFVLDGPTNSSYGSFNYTEDNGYFTDVWLPSQSGYDFVLDPTSGHSSDAWVKGDLNFDGVFNNVDIEAFKNGWLTARADMPGNGPQTGDYLTLSIGDLDLDGDTDLADWIRLRQYNSESLAGLTIPSLSQLNNPIPEPSTVVILVIGSLGLFGVRRRFGS